MSLRVDSRDCFEGFGKSRMGVYGTCVCVCCLGFVCFRVFEGSLSQARGTALPIRQLVRSRRHGETAFVSLHGFRDGLRVLQPG